MLLPNMRLKKKFCNRKRICNSRMLLKKKFCNWKRFFLLAFFCIFCVFLLLAWHSLDKSSSVPKQEIRYSEILEKEIHHFLYFAVPKTGSTIIRKELRKYCEFRDLSCLCFELCGEYWDSFFNCSKIKFTFTFENIEQCCSAKKKHRNGETNYWDGLVDHYDLTNYPNNDYRNQSAKYLEENIPKDAFRFMSLRNPIDHFISWEHERCNKRDNGIDNPKKDLAVWFCNEKNISRVIEQHGNLPKNSTGVRLDNKQSRYLGFNGTQESLDEVVIPLLYTMDYILFSDQMDQGWCHIKKTFNWPETFFKTLPAAFSTTYALSEISMKQLKAVQWADMQLLEHAKKLVWSKFRYEHPECY